MDNEHHLLPDRGISRIFKSFLLCFSPMNFVSILDWGSLSDITQCHCKCLLGTGSAVTELPITDRLEISINYQDVV